MIFSVFQKNWFFGYSWSTLLWYRCYYPHQSRDALSPVCGIFFLWWLFSFNFYLLEMFNRPSVAGAVLQTSPLLIKWLRESSFSSKSSKHLHSQTVRARVRDLKFWDNVHHPLCDTWYRDCDQSITFDSDAALSIGITRKTRKPRKI